MGKKIVIQRKGQTMKEGTIGKWLVADLAKVRTGEMIYMLEYDKATTEIESPADGVIHIYVEEGATLPVGALIAEITAEGEAPQFKDQAAINQAAPVAAAVNSVATASAAPVAAAPVVEPIPVAAPAPAAVSVPKVSAAVVSANGRIKASPYAKKLANARGIDLRMVSPSGTGGKIVARDLENIAAGSAAPAVYAAQGDRREPMTTIRKRIAQNMAQSYFSIPVVTYSTEVDFSNCLIARDMLNKEYAKKNIKISVNDIIMKVVGTALRKAPNINVSIDGNDIVYHGDVHVGMAVDAPAGLVVPVVRNVDRLSFLELASETKRLIGESLDGTIEGDEMSGATFTVSNLGGKGVDMFTPIINAPQSAILGVGRVVKKPVVNDDDELEIKPMMVLSLTADHRVIDGAPAADFLALLKNIIENPILMLS